MVYLTAATKPDKMEQDEVESTLKSSANFPIGAAVNPDLLKRDSLYKLIVIKEFNSITTENALKWASVHPEPGKYNFSKADSIVAFAKRYGIRVHGHVLISVSEGSLPKWIKEYSGDSTKMEKIFKDHIQTVIKRYKGEIHSWDVVNETFDDKGLIRTKTQSNKNDNIWYKYLGKDYTARAFKYANEADPKALLFYNDNNQEKSERKLEAILNMIKCFKQEDIPIHGIGIQMHTDVYMSKPDFINAMVKVLKSNLHIHISELDIRINPKNEIGIDSIKRFKIQGELFRFISNFYKKDVPYNQQFGITFWNVTDKDSWINNKKGIKDNCLLFDYNYRKNQSYKAFIEGLTK
ncbi:endo-1,4-beta-xylanase [Larkinella arboricola]